MNEKHLCEDIKCKHKPSSFHHQDAKIVFKEIGLSKGQTFLDLGCGIGNYSFYAAEIVGNKGSVFAIDANKEAIKLLEEKRSVKNIENIFATLADITTPFKIADKSVDICFIATVLHSPQNIKNSKEFFKEIKRVLKPSGKLAIIEIKKEPTPFGPPIDIRISPDELNEIMSVHGLKNVQYKEFKYTYLSQFVY